MRIPSESLAPPVPAAKVDPVEKKPSQEGLKFDFDFMKYPAEGLNRFLSASRARELQAKEEKRLATTFSKIRKIVFPSSVDKKIVKEISGIASIVRASMYIPFRSGASIHELADQLHKFKRSNPVEFKVALPGLKAREVSVACHSLSAFGSLWDAADCVADGDAEGMERNINRAVKHLVNCGLPADDPSLKKFHESYLLNAQKIRLAASAA